MLRDAKGLLFRCKDGQLLWRRHFDPVRFNHDTGTDPLQAIDDHLLGRFQASFDNAQATSFFAERDRTVLQRAFGIHYQYKAAG